MTAGQIETPFALRFIKPVEMTGWDRLQKFFFIERFDLNIEFIRTKFGRYILVIAVTEVAPWTLFSPQ